MAKAFHVNDNGEPGRCRAFQGNCPFGDEKHHYSSAEDAREAFERANAGNTFTPTFGPTPPKLKRSKLEEIARTSKDERELRGVVEGITTPHFQRKVAKALAENPNVPGHILAEARSRTGLAYHEFVALEAHPNYPLNRLTGEGAYMLSNTLTKDGYNELHSRDDVGDTLLYKSAMFKAKYDEGVKLALSNGNNEIRDSYRDWIASENTEWAKAAGASGKFPSERALNEQEYYPRDGASLYVEVKVPDEAILNAATTNPDNAKLMKIYDKYKNTQNLQAAAKAIFANPHASDETKRVIAKDVKNFVDEVQRLAQV